MQKAKSSAHKLKQRSKSAGPNRKATTLPGCPVARFAWLALNLELQIECNYLTAAMSFLCNCRPLQRPALPVHGFAICFHTLRFTWPGAEPINVYFCFSLDKRHMHRSRPWSELGPGPGPGPGAALRACSRLSASGAANSLALELWSC